LFYEEEFMLEAEGEEFERMKEAKEAKQDK